MLSPTILFPVDPMDSEEVVFRKYEPADLRRCAELAEQAWPVRDKMGEEPDGTPVFEPWIESSSYSSTWTELASISGEVIGFLFGTIDKQKPKGINFGGISDQLWMVGRFLSGGHGRFRMSFSTMIGFMFTEFKLAVNRPKADAEIVLLIVDSRFRGKGIGKALVDRFVKAAKDAGSYAIALYTDDKSSNWRFYEVYGFRKVTTFYDNISTYFVGEPANAIYYVLDLKPEGAPRQANP
jgi:ribosomal protein S18 acetylase RimI-like enzyme